MYINKLNYEYIIRTVDIGPNKIVVPINRNLSMDGILGQVGSRKFSNKKYKL